MIATTSPNWFTDPHPKGLISDFDYEGTLSSMSWEDIREAWIDALAKDLDSYTVVWSGYREFELMCVWMANTMEIIQEKSENR